MKRRFPFSLGLASLLILLQPQSGRGSDAEAPASEMTQSAEASTTDKDEFQGKSGPEAVKRAPSKILQAIAPDNWKEEPKQKQQGLSSWYGKQFHGKKTASGEIFDMNAMTAAHRTLPLQTWVRVTNLANGREVLVRINDRGPRLRSRIIDLSQGAAQALGFSKKGLARVEVEVVPREEMKESGKK